MAKLGIMSDQQLPPQQPRPRKIPPHILRRRRIVAVIILCILLALIGWGIWALIGLFLPGDDDQAVSQPQPTVTDTVSPSPEESGGGDDGQGVVACDPQMLTVTGGTDQESYGPDEIPEFTLTVTHDGDVLVMHSGRISEFVVAMLMVSLCPHAPARWIRRSRLWRWNRVSLKRPVSSGSELVPMRAVRRSLRMLSPVSISWLLPWGSARPSVGSNLKGTSFTRRRD